MLNMLYTTTIYTIKMPCFKTIKRSLTMSLVKILIFQFIFSYNT